MLTICVPGYIFNQNTPAKARGFFGAENFAIQDMLVNIVAKRHGINFNCVGLHQHIKTYKGPHDRHGGKKLWGYIR